MDMLSILIFFAITFGFGLAITRFARESENFLERNLMRIGIGLGAFISLGLLLNLIKIPLDYRIFLAISVLCIFFFLFRNRAQLKHAKITGLKLTQTDLMIFIMLLLFFITSYMYSKGAFAYPYLEDDDSWGHALAVKYISTEKTLFSGEVGVRYLDPYPPAYDMVLGVLHQTNDSVYWTLKFFNALIISLSIIFFYFFASALTSSHKKAIFSAFALFTVPSFLSHFIWSISITMPLFFVSFYAVEKIKNDRMWWIASAVAISATLTTSPSHSAYFGLFFIIYLAARILTDKKFPIYEFFAGFSGFLLSSILWWIPMVFKHGLKGILLGFGTNPADILTIPGTGDRIYSISDFIFARKENMINNPIGIGLVLSILLVIFLAYAAFRYYRASKNRLTTVLLLFLVISSVMVFALSKSYLKNPAKRNLERIEKGTVPFSEFISDQSFLVIALLFMVYLAIALIVKLRQDTNSKEKYLAIIFLWAIFSFYAVNAAPFYYRLSPFRAWMLLAIPVALLCGESAALINNFAKAVAGTFTKSNTASILISLAVLALIAYGVIMTSFVQKYAVNTALWHPGGFWTSNDEIQGYLWLKENIPSETKVFTFSNNALVIGLDKFICHWCIGVQDYQRNGFNSTAEDSYNWLKKEQYKYVIIDGQATRRFGINETNNKIKGLIGSGRFKPVFGNNGIIIFGVA